MANDSEIDASDIASLVLEQAFGFTNCFEKNKSFFFSQLRPGNRITGMANSAWQRMAIFQPRTRSSDLKTNQSGLGMRCRGYNIFTLECVSGQIFAIGWIAKKKKKGHPLF